MWPSFHHLNGPCLYLRVFLKRIRILIHYFYCFSVFYLINLFVSLLFPTMCFLLFYFFSFCVRNLVHLSSFSHFYWNRCLKPGIFFFSLLFCLSDAHVVCSLSLFFWNSLISLYIPFITPQTFNRKLWISR